MFKEKLKTSIGLKIAVLSGLTLALLIPALMIQGTVHEREKRRAEVLKEITSKWGGSQNIVGPVLSIPVEYIMADSKGKIRRYTNMIYLLPDSLNIQGAMQPEVRYRGIYEILLYTANLGFSGKFNLVNLGSLDLKDGLIKYDQAILEFGISDLKGLNNRMVLEWGDAQENANPGIINCSTIKKGFHMRAPLTREKSEYAFRINLDLNGSESLSFIPVGEENHASLQSNWQHPSFMGDFLPKVRQIDEKHFTAEWKILNLNRNFPQISLGNPIEFDNTNFGVQLIYPVDQYQKTTRTVKYAIMFIGLTFIVFLLIEILNRKLLHPIQYLLVGSGLVLFYILLLSLSEHMSFPLAYFLAALSLIVLVSFYARAILKDTRFMLVIAGVLTTLYGFLYINLQLQDYALLLGSIGLFVMLAVVMYLTRNIDWFSKLNVEEQKAS
jgi:inner membrane protein